MRTASQLPTLGQYDRSVEEAELADDAELFDKLMRQELALSNSVGLAIYGAESNEGVLF